MYSLLLALILCEVTFKGLTNLAAFYWIIRFKFIVLIVIFEAELSSVSACFFLFDLGLIGNCLIPNFLELFEELLFNLFPDELFIKTALVDRGAMVGPLKAGDWW